MNYAIILSGGIGSRMNNGDFPKQYIEINSKPILVYTLEKFEKSNAVNSIIIVAATQWQKEIRNWIKKYKINKFFKFALPGDSRQESILNGLTTCIDDSKNLFDNVIIHDAVRPLVSLNTIEDCFEQLGNYEGVMPAIPVNDTTYYSENAKDITSLLDRSKLFAGQSPEAYNLKKYYEINANATEKELNTTRGSSEIAFKHGMKIKIIEGDYRNFKITTPPDLERFKSIIGD